MPKCPRCGSTAQVREEEAEYGWGCVIRRYSCGCGNIFSLLYPCNNQHEEHEIEED